MLYTPKKVSTAPYLEPEKVSTAQNRPLIWIHRHIVKPLILSWGCIAPVIQLIWSWNPIMRYFFMVRGQDLSYIKICVHDIVPFSSILLFIILIFLPLQIITLLLSCVLLSLLLSPATAAPAPTFGTLANVLLAKALVLKGENKIQPKHNCVSLHHDACLSCIMSCVSCILSCHVYSRWYSWLSC